MVGIADYGRVFGDDDDGDGCGSEAGGVGGEEGG